MSDNAIINAAERARMHLGLPNPDAFTLSGAIAFAREHPQVVARFGYNIYKQAKFGYDAFRSLASEFGTTDDLHHKPPGGSRRITGAQRKLFKKGTCDVIQELNYLDTIISVNHVASVVLAKYFIGDISQGNTVNNREGICVMLKRLECEIRMAAQPQLSTALFAALKPPNGFVSFFVVLDTQPNGVAFTSTDFVDLGATVPLLNFNNRNRFLVLHAGRFTFTTTCQINNGLNYTLFNNAHQRFSVPLNVPARFLNNVAGDITQVVSNALYFCYAGNLDLEVEVSNRLFFSG